MNPVVQYDSVIADKPTAASTTCQKCRFMHKGYAKIIYCSNPNRVSKTDYNAVEDVTYLPMAKDVRSIFHPCDGFEKAQGWLTRLVHLFN